jgi:hypothetical protein
VVLTAWKVDMLEGSMTSSARCRPLAPRRAECTAQAYGDEARVAYDLHDARRLGSAGVLRLES